MEQSLEPTKNQKMIWDNVGIFFSGLCALHCLLVPVLLISFPSLGAYLVDGQDPLHKAIFAVILVVAAVAFSIGYRIHRNSKPILLMSLGMATIMLGTFVAPVWWGQTWEYLLTVLGGGVLIRAHFLNRAHCSACEKNNSCPVQSWNH